MDREIAILGANSHIAQGLIFNFTNRTTDNVHLFTHSRFKYIDANCIYHPKYNDFFNHRYDVLINCVGTGIIKDNFTQWFDITEKYDKMCLDYLENRPNSLYINFSSGSAANKQFNPDNLSTSNYLPIVKLYHEAKHRSLQDLNIVDLRLYSYFSQWANLEENYFINSAVKCLLEGTEFRTNTANITRDFIHHYDIFRTIQTVMSSPLNTSSNISSKSPTTKIEVLAYLKGLGLKVCYTDEVFDNATGAKVAYYPDNMSNRLFSPIYSSMDTIIEAVSQFRSYNTTERVCWAPHPC